MFKPNQNCVVYRVSGKTDVYGLPLTGQKFKERCSIIQLSINNAKSAVRADTSASRGNAREFETVAKILMTKSSVVAIDDMLEVVGVKLRVASVFPRHDLQGKLDHIEITCTFWSAQ